MPSAIDTGRVLADLVTAAKAVAHATVKLCG
jgi:hypothetical protein